MSRMSQLHAELSEQAYELGFESIEDAEKNGYTIGYNRKGWALVPDINKAHEDWLKEKEQVLDELNDVINDGDLDWGEIVRRVEHAIEFINKGEI